MSGEQHVPSAAEVDAAARVMFEPPSTTPAEPEYTWAEMVAEDPSRADLWREDARAALVAAAEVRALPDREAIARTLAATDDENDCFDEVDAWNALEEWEREAHPDDEPMMEREDCEYYLRRADAVLALFGQEGQR